MQTTRIFRRVATDNRLETVSRETRPQKAPARRAAGKQDAVPGASGSAKMLRVLASWRDKGDGADISQRRKATKMDKSSDFRARTRVKMAVIFGLTTVIPLLVMVYIIYAAVVLREGMGVVWMSCLGLIALSIALLGGKLMKQHWQKVGHAIEAIDRLSNESDPLRKPAHLRPTDEIDRIPTVVNHLVEIAKKQRNGLENYGRQVQVLNLKVKEANEQLRRISRTDSLTGLYNRRHFDDRARQELARAKRYGRSLALAMIELDFFSNYKNNAGAPAADSALHTVATIIRESIRRTDLPFRYGDAQFAIIFPETGAEKATFAVERIRLAVEKCRFERESSQPNGRLTVSVGISILEKECDSVAPFVSAASEALHKARSTGRNRVVALLESQPAALTRSRT